MPSLECINTQEDPHQRKTSFYSTSTLRLSTTPVTSYSSLLPITPYQLPLLPLQVPQWPLTELSTSGMSIATTTSAAESKSP